MILSSIFGKTKPINFILLLVYMLLVFAITVVAGARDFISTVSVPGYILCILIVGLSLFVLEFVCKRNNLSLNNNYVIFLFVTLICAFPAFFLYPKITVASWFVLLAVRKMINLKSQLGVKRKIFDAALWLGIAVLCYNWAILTLIPLYVAIAIYAGKDFKNLFIPIIALGTVLLLTYTGFLWFDLLEEFKLFLAFKMQISKEDYMRLYIYIPSIALTLLTIAAVLTFFFKAKSKTTSVKNSLLIVLLVLFAVILAVGIGPKFEGASYMLLAFPLAVLAGNFLEKLHKKWMRELILWFFLLLPFMNLML
ncbi:DUF6427 family protein [Flavobacteriaceae bacterium M23B6Z8]